jgi:hypothetical protein
MSFSGGYGVPKLTVIVTVMEKKTSSAATGRSHVAKGRWLHGAAAELAAIANALDDSLNVATRDVHTWIESGASGRADWHESAIRRADAIRRLFEHSSTPALAAWLIRYAHPARLEVGLAEGHRVIARIRAGQLTPEAAVGRLIRTANRSWDKDRSEGNGIDPDALPLEEPPRHKTDSLVPETMKLLGYAGIHPSEAASRLIAEAVDQAVDFLADEAERTGRSGPAVLQPARARTVNRDRRASGRVASSHPAGAVLRSLVFGKDGLVAQALMHRFDVGSTHQRSAFKPSTTTSWAADVSRLEAAIDSECQELEVYHSVAADESVVGNVDGRVAS